MLHLFFSNPDPDPRLRKNFQSPERSFWSRQSTGPLRAPPQSRNADPNPVAQLPDSSSLRITRASPKKVFRTRMIILPSLDLVPTGGGSGNRNSVVRTPALPARCAPAIEEPGTRASEGEVSRDWPQPTFDAKHSATPARAGYKPSIRAKALRRASALR